MGLIEKSGQELRRERCVTELRELCKGEGVITDPNDSPEMRSIANYFEFDIKDGPRFVELWSDSLPQDNPFVMAFLNALFADGEGSNLTERREEYLRAHTDISARTLMRYEIEGANIFVRHLEMAEDTLRREKEFQESEDAARDLDIATLRSRINELEALVLYLAERVAASSHLLPENVGTALANLKQRH